MIDNLLAFLLNVVNILINLLFLKCFFPKRRFTAKDICLIGLLIIISVIVSITLHAVAPLKVLLNIVSGVVVTALVFNVSWKKSLVYNMLFFGICGTAEIAVLFVFQYAFNANVYSELTNSNGAAIMEIISYLIVLLITVVINIIHKKSVITRLDTRGWIAFIMYPAITLVVISLLLYVPLEEISEKVFRIIIVFAVSMLFLSIIQFYLLENIMIRESEIYNKQALIEQAEHVNQMYRSLSEEREIQKARAHDYLNHLNVLLALAEHNNSVEEIKYIKEQIGASSEIVDIIDTGNAVINAVLNYKYREAKKKSIIMPLIIDDLSNLKISESDIVTILSNILDNAIEATEKCDNKKIVLQISKQDQKHLLYIDSSNTCLPDLFIEEKLHTTKENKENHGYGISNIKYTVEKNNGECIIDQKDGIFRIIITIPL